MGAPGILAASDFGLSYGLEWAGLALVAIVFWRYVRPPLSRAMSAQAERIRSSLQAGDEARAEAEAVVARERAALEEAKAEAETILDQARHGADRLVAEGERRAEEEYARVLARAEVEIALERSRIQDEIGAELSEIVLAYATRLVEAELDQANQRRLVDEAIAAAEAEAS